MTDIEIGFITLVVAAFVVFMATLAFTVWWSERGKTAPEAQRHKGPAARQDNEPTPGQRRAY